jgi:hypothetical protein
MRDEEGSSISALLLSFLLSTFSRSASEVYRFGTGRITLALSPSALYRMRNAL